MNKKILLLICAFSAFIANAQEAYTGKGDTKMHVGANFQKGGTGIVAGADFGLGENISVGFTTSYLLGVSDATIDGKTVKPEFKDRIDAKLRFNANIGKVLTLPEQLDVYPGLDLGAKNFGGHLGARYFFSEGFGLQTEFGVPFAKYDSDVKNFEKLNNQFYATFSMVFNL
jgi:outer membrane protein G